MTTEEQKPNRDHSADHSVDHSNLSHPVEIPPPDIPAPDTPIRAVEPIPPEYGGRKGVEPTRYGDWEMNGKCVDF